MNMEREQEARKPVSLWNKTFNIDYTELFTTLGSIGLNLVTASWKDAAKDAIGLFKAVSAEKLTWQESAWLLIHRALVMALCELMHESQQSFPRGKDAPKMDHARLKELGNQVEQAMDDVPVPITQDFFNHPSSVPLLPPLRENLETWLNELGLNQAQAKGVSRRLPVLFTYALHREWQERALDYAKIKEAVNTPFTKAAKEEAEWQRYHAWLRTLPNEPMFHEAFAIKDVYVPLRACYELEQKSRLLERDDQEEEKTHQLVMLKEHIREWLGQADNKDCLRLVTGGPGCGKSTFAKILAAELTEETDIRVLFIPLYRFFVEADLIEGVGRFIALEGRLRSNPLKSNERTQRVCIIFDGLDELPHSDNKAQHFIEHIQYCLDSVNHERTFLQIIITGRELAVNEFKNRFRKKGQIVTMLPYLIETDTAQTLNGQNNDIGLDQRNTWWKQYGEATDADFEKIPEEITGEHLEEITAQPLLNYLVALARDKGFEFSQETNLSKLYEYLICSVHDREWEDRRKIPGVQSLDEEDFLRILEEIAITAWHGGEVRTTTLRAIEEQCRSVGLDTRFEQFKKDCSENLVRLLAAFFFKESEEDRAGNQTFQFTHKSFGEYLVARRIIREVDELFEQERTPRWTLEDSLKNWALLCGPATLDQYILRFLRDGIRLEKERDKPIGDWQKMIASWIGTVLKDGFPMQLCGLDTYHTMYGQSKNAEESLLATLNGCARATEALSEINFPTPTAFGTWLYKLQGQCSSGNYHFINSCLSYLNLTSQYLEFHSFISCNLEASHMRHCNLHKAVFIYYISRSFTGEQNILRSNLNRADLQKADLQKANLREADLREADLQGADLRKANLQGADLRRADLRKANLQGADLEGVDFLDAKLEGADLRNTNYEEALNLPENLAEIAKI